VGNTLFIYPSFSKLLIENTEDEAKRLAKHLMGEIFPEKTELSRYHITTEITYYIQQTLRHFHLIKLKIFTKSGEIIYSTNPSDIGEINKKNYFHNIVAKGQSFSKVVEKNTMSLEDEKITAHVVETYVPIIKNNNFIGAFEIYYNITNRVESLNQLLTSTTVVLLSLSIILTGSIFMVLRNAAKNISQRENAEEELIQAKEAAEAASNAKSEFLANMSHELRTPLNHIIGFTELVVDKQVGPLNTVQDEYLNDVIVSSRHLLSLINEILDLSKVKAGKLDLQLCSVNLRKLLENSLTMIKENAFKHGIELSNYLNGIPDTITVDERKLKQIMYNLLSNAVKFTPKGGKISITTRTCEINSALFSTAANNSNGGIEISVADTGIGLNSEDLDRIFTPFEQVENSNSCKFPGTGLGLSLTKSLVELHDGRIWAESEGKGKGSTFSFIIPVNPAFSPLDSGMENQGGK
jgi:signal transduction histidine kinase